MNDRIPAVPPYLMRRPSPIRFMYADDNTLTIVEGDKSIVLSQADILRMKTFYDRFEITPEVQS